MKEANSTMTTSKQQFQDMKNMIERDLDAKKAGTAQAQHQILDLVGVDMNGMPGQYGLQYPPGLLAIFALLFGFD